MQKPVPPPRTKQKIVYSGWLRKQGGQFRSLRTRWFEVKGDQLYYFKDRSEPKPLGFVPLAGNEVVRCPREDNEPGKFKFEIKSGEGRDGRQVIDGHDTFVLFASTIEEMEQWISALNRIIYQPFGGGMFGGDLAETIKYEARKGGGFVPIIIHVCIEKIKQDGLDEEGLFRLPGNMKATGELKAAFNKGQNPDISDSDIHTVASLLKMYLRELPEPLIPYDFFEVFLTSAKCYEMYEEDGIKSIQKHLTQLPKPNFNLLKVLCRFLFEVQEHSGQNKMDTRNIAMVFGPNILRSGSEDPQVMMESTGQVTNLISILIRRHELFFPTTDDEHHYTPEAANGADEVKTGQLVELDQEASTDPTSPSGNFTDGPFSTPMSRNGPLTDSQIPGIQLEELESETQLQQQQIKDLKTKLENERKVREMLTIRLEDEQRAREAAEDRLRKMHLALETLSVKFGVKLTLDEK